MNQIGEMKWEAKEDYAGPMPDPLDLGLGSTGKLVTVCIAWPMRGYPRYNFDEFYRAETALLAMGFNPIDPARIDEEQGFDPDDAQQIILPSMVEEFVWRDIELIIQADGLCLLPGWGSECRCHGRVLARALA